MCIRDSLRDDLVADSQVFERLLKRVHVVAGRGTGVPDSGHRGQHFGAALNCRALHVVEHAAHATQLLATACATRATVHQHRQRRTVAGRGASVVTVEQQHAAVGRCGAQGERLSLIHI